MGAVGDFLFGSEGEPGQVVDVTPPELKALRGKFAGGVTDLIDTGGGPEWQGPLVAPLSSAEQQLVNQAIGQAQPGGATAASQSFLTSLLNGGGVNPNLDAAIKAAQRPVIEAYNENVLPRLKDQFTASGQFIQRDSSSPFDLAAARASSGLANALADISTNISFQGYENERNRALQGAGLAPAVDRAALDKTVAGLQAAALPRMIEDLGIERGMQEFQRRINVLLQALGLAGGASQPNPVVIPGTEGSPGLLNSILSSASQGFGEIAGSELAALAFA